MVGIWYFKEPTNVANMTSIGMGLTAGLLFVFAKASPTAATAGGGGGSSAAARRRDAAIGMAAATAMAGGGGGGTMSTTGQQQQLSTDNATKWKVLPGAEGGRAAQDGGPATAAGGTGFRV